MRLQITLALLLSAASVPFGLQAQETPLDRSEHRLQMIPVAAGVQLEVLDWGGSGPPIVFLAGFGNSAHVFDGFASQFADKYHVIGISRREFGGSTREVESHDSATLAKDIVTVLDSLHIQRANFVAHSFGGSELNYLGAYHADRVARLIYIDAGYDFARLYAEKDWQSSFPVPEPPVASYSNNSLAMWLLDAERLSGPGYPISELRQMFRLDEEGNVIGSKQSPGLSGKFQAGATPAAFPRITAPVLALYADPEIVTVAYPYWNSIDVAGQARLRRLSRCPKRSLQIKLCSFVERLRAHEW